MFSLAFLQSFLISENSLQVEKKAATNIKDVLSSERSRIILSEEYGSVYKGNNDLKV
jgi:hypothetical protein